MSPPEQPTLSEIKAEKEQHISWDTDCNLFQFTSALEAVCIVYDEIQQDTLSHATPFIRQDLDYPFGKNADSVSLQANCVSVLLLLLHILLFANAVNKKYGADFWMRLHIRQIIRQFRLHLFPHLLFNILLAVIFLFKAIDSNITW